MLPVLGYFLPFSYIVIQLGKSILRNGMELSCGMKMAMDLLLYCELAQ